MIVSTSHAAYLGGTHGGYYILYDNIDMEESTIIKEKDLFKEGYEDSLASIIQEKITERNNSEKGRRSYKFNI